MISPRAQASSNARSRPMFASPGAGASTIRAIRAVATVATASDVESNVDDIAVTHHVIPAFESLLPPFAQHVVRARVEQLLGVGHLGADEAASNVRMDARGGVERGLPLTEIPGAHLGIAGGEEGDELQQAVCA